jgi:HEAT repeat protein
MTSAADWQPDDEATDSSHSGDGSEALRAALRCGDALACRQQAEQAGGNMDRSAVRGLCEVLRVPGRKRNPWWASRQRKRAWVWVRIAAVNALGRIGDTDALPALTDALFDPDPAVREAAAFVLPRYGNHALHPLIRALRKRPDWNLHSMQLLLTTLGTLRNRRATPALLRVLHEKLPVDPTRWARQTFLLPFKLLSTVTVCWWIVCLLTNPPIGDPGWQGWLGALLALLIRSFVPFLFLYMVSVGLVSVHVFNRVAAGEREELEVAALQALAALDDKRALSAVTALAVGPNTRASQAALLTLRALLPLVSAEDDEHFPAQARRQLVRALMVAAGSSQPEAAVEIVRALEHVGDGEAVEAVERVAQRGSAPGLRREAARVLPILRARKRRERAAAHLLRAATSPDDPAEELLRASEAGETTPPDELLRMPDEE